jgi:hypothetical protein
MKKTYKSVFATLLAVSLFSLNAVAQTNFSGTWSLNESKSDFGGSQFRFAATAMVVTQDAKLLSVESTMPNRDGGEMKASSKYNLDGTVSENPMFNSTRKTTATWSDDKTTLKMAHTMTFDMNGETRTMNSTETWQLAEDGKVLKVTSFRTGRDGNEMKTVAAYDKK